MDNEQKNEIKAKVRGFVDHRQVNIIITSLLIFLFLYLALVTCLGKNVLDPLSDVVDVERNITSDDGSLDESRKAIKSSISVFFIVVLGLIVGRLFFYVHLPPLFGSLLVGIAVKNIPLIDEWLYIHPAWDMVLRKLAFALIMIRCSIGINLNVVKSSPRLLVSLGVIGPLVESLAVFLASHLLFHFPLGISIVFGFLLAATSPAVTVPSMLHLQNLNYGVEKGIPSLVLACASADNVLLIVAYTVSVGLVFASGAVAKVIVFTLLEILASVLIGLGLGWLLWWFPRTRDTYTHLARGLLLISLCCAQLLTAIRLGIEFAGSITLVTTCLTAALRWKEDSDKKTHIEQRAFAIMWDLIFQPVLFVLIGMKFEIVHLTLNGVLTGLACIGIGVLARALTVILLTIGTGLKFSEQLVFVFSFLPKATVQAALAPSIVISASTFPDLIPYASIILSACVVAILITAPLGQLALDLFGPKLLHRDHKKSNSVDGFYGSTEEVRGETLAPTEADPSRISDHHGDRKRTRSLSTSSSPRKIHPWTTRGKTRSLENETIPNPDHHSKQAN